MERKVVSGLMLTLLLMSMVTLALNIQPVKAGETIYIRADGSIEPPTAPISTFDNITYTFFDNIHDEIVVERDNIVVDGANYTLQGTGSGFGFYLNGISNVTIKNIEIKAFEYGILLWESSSNTILESNLAQNSWYCVCLYSSSNNIISRNNMTNNSRGIYLFESSNNVISENNVTNDGNGICLDRSSNNTISRNNITENRLNGIMLYWSSNNSISGNNITNNGCGIWLGQASNNTISGNIITQNVDNGILLYAWSEYNTISGNIITQTQYPAIRLYKYVYHNTISGNDVTNNGYGIWQLMSSDNTIYHNNFLDNSEQVYSINSTNVWDGGYPSGGNFWSDHVTVDDCCGINQDEPGSDGIVDEPYVIDDYNRDNYPLVEPWSPLPATVDELKTEIEKCWTEGEIDKQGIVKSLIAKLNVAQKLIDKGKIDEAKSILEDDFIPQVQNLSGIHITVEAADILIQSAEYILSHL